MKGKIIKFFRKYEEELDVAVIVSVIATSVYGCFWAINWMLTKFFQVTGLWYLLLMWVSFAFARSIFLYLEHRDARLKDDDDEPSVL